jgi:kynurenine formamidase
MPERTPVTLLDELRHYEWIDLTHSFDPGIPHSPLFPAEKRTLLYHYDAGVGAIGDGFLAHRYELVGQWGTHVDPPAHFIPGLRHQDEIPVAEMMLPLIVLDVETKVRTNPDYCVQLEDLARWERHHGRVPPESFVALHTGWGKRWADPAAMRNLDDNGVAHTPGWSLAVLQELYEVRRIRASGHDMTDTDPGHLVSGSGEAPLERYVLSRNCYQIEVLANLDLVPPRGAIIVASWAKARGGSGFPARVFAIAPRRR